MQALTQANMKPVVDRTFPLAQVAEAYRYLKAGRHFSKVVVTMRVNLKPGHWPLRD